jgi:hypothetical protein
MHITPPPQASCRRPWAATSCGGWWTRRGGRRGWWGCGEWSSGARPGRAVVVWLWWVALALLLPLLRLSTKPHAVPHTLFPPPPHPSHLRPSRAITFIDNHDTGSTLNHWPFPSHHLQVRARPAAALRLVEPLYPTTPSFQPPTFQPPTANRRRGTPTSSSTPGRPASSWTTSRATATCARCVCVCVWGGGVIPDTVPSRGGE